MNIHNLTDKILACIIDVYLEHHVAHLGECVQSPHVSQAKAQEVCEFVGWSINHIVTQIPLTLSNGMTQVFGRSVSISRVSRLPVGLQSLLWAHVHAVGASRRVVRAGPMQSGVILSDILEPLCDGGLTP
jgi:hypothetical protein